MIDAPTVQALTTVAGATLLTAAIVQVLFHVWAPDSALQDRIGPLVAVVIGIVIVEVATFTVVTGPTKVDVFQGAVNGLFSGLAAIGVHNLIIKPTEKAVGGG